jgi:hypothetical protein
VRTFSEGLIELDDRETVSALASSTGSLPVDSKGFVLLRTSQRGKSFRVFRPPLIHDVDIVFAMLQKYQDVDREAKGGEKVAMMDYVIVHELVHLLERNHTPKFRKIMDRVLPDWHQRETDLDAGWRAYVAFGIEDGRGRKV